MGAIYFDRSIPDDQRRARLYEGDLFVYSPSPESLELVALARQLLAKAFDGLDPELAQHEMDVHQYAAILARVKPEFIHHPECKRLVPAILARLGCDLDKVYFDVPRMRSSTSHGYLTTGIAYAFHPHRDTWYSAPMCQINWWMPIFEIEAGNAMAFHPYHFDNPVDNDSECYDYQAWNASSRFTAAQHVGKDTRRQPQATRAMKTDPSTVVVAPPGGLLLFSGAQLHSSIPNQTGRTRFSIDFRTVHVGDLRSLAGAPNLDSKCTGSAIGDYLRGSDLSHVPEDVQAVYLPGHPQPVTGLGRPTADLSYG